MQNNFASLRIAAQILALAPPEQKTAALQAMVPFPDGAPVTYNNAEPNLAKG